MTATLAPTEVAGQPAAPLRALAGMVAALAAVGVGHGVAGLLDPVTSPILAVGSVLIDAAPTPAKEFAVRTFGNYDKPILIGSVGLVLVIFAAGLGLIAWRRRRLAMIGISLLGVAGMAAALYRGSLVDGIPSLVAGAVGVLALSILTRHRRRSTGAPDRRTAPQPTVAGCWPCWAGSPSWPPSAAPAALRWTAPGRPGWRPAGPSDCRPRPRPPCRSPTGSRWRASAASSPRWRSSTGSTSAWSPPQWTRRAGRCRSTAWSTTP